MFTEWKEMGIRLYPGCSTGSMMCIHNGVAFIMELGYDYSENEIEIVLDYLGYDFERDKFNFREMVKKALIRFSRIQ